MKVAKLRVIAAQRCAKFYLLVVKISATPGNRVFSDTGSHKVYVQITVEFCKYRHQFIQQMKKDEVPAIDFESASTAKIGIRKGNPDQFAFPDGFAQIFKIILQSVSVEPVQVW